MKTSIGEHMGTSSCFRENSVYLPFFSHSVELGSCLSCFGSCSSSIKQVLTSVGEILHHLNKFRSLLNSFGFLHPVKFVKIFFPQLRAGITVVETRLQSFVVSILLMTSQGQFQRMFKKYNIVESHHLFKGGFQNSHGLE